MSRRPAAPPFPWEAVIAFGLGVLRLPPATFWSLTLPELAAILRHAGAGMPLVRADLDGLMRRFPDGAT